MRILGYFLVIIPMFMLEISNVKASGLGPMMLNNTELTKLTKRFDGILADYLNILFYPYQNWDLIQRIHCGTVQLEDESTRMYNLHYMSMNYESKHEIYCISEVVSSQWELVGDYVTENRTQCNLARDKTWSECGKLASVQRVQVEDEEVAQYLVDTSNYLKDLEISLRPTSCASSSVYGVQWLRNGTDVNGEKVFCDGGWTVVQRRFNGHEDFQKPFSEYEEGFGCLEKEFWIGLAKIYDMTYLRGCRLRVDIWDFKEDHAFAEYSAFSLSGQGTKYRLHVGGYTGTAGDGLGPLDGAKFNAGNKCLNGNDNGGWWSRDCYSVNLNGKWGMSEGSWNNILWNTWKGFDVALMATTMKLRCE